MCLCQTSSAVTLLLAVSVECVEYAVAVYSIVSAVLCGLLLDINKVSHT